MLIDLQKLFTVTFHGKFVIKLALKVRTERQK